MTREKMIEWLKLHKHIETRGARDFESDYAQGCIDGYEYSQMNIESRVCENCIHSSIDYSGTQHQCILLRASFGDDFGCNYFKSEVESR